MGMFDNLNVEDKAMAADKVGSGERVSFEKIRKTGVSGFTIKNAWAGASQVRDYQGKESGGALNITLQLEGADGTLNTFEYVTAGVQKDRKPTFVYDKYRKLHFLLTGNEVKNIATEPKPVMVWDNEARQEVEEIKEVITEWVGKEINAAHERVLEDKYNADGEMKDFVQVRAFLDATTGRSYAEVKSGDIEATYKREFLEKRDEDFIVDKRKKTKHLDIPVIFTAAEEKALKKAEKEADNGGFESGNEPELGVDEDEIPF